MILPLYEPPLSRPMSFATSFRLISHMDVRNKETRDEVRQLALPCPPVVDLPRPVSLMPLSQSLCRRSPVEQWTSVAEPQIQCSGSRGAMSGCVTPGTRVVSSRGREWGQLGSASVGLLWSSVGVSAASVELCWDRLWLVRLDQHYGMPSTVTAGEHELRATQK